MCSQTDLQANNSTNTTPPSPSSFSNTHKTTASSASKTSKTMRSESASPRARRSDYDYDDEDLKKQNMSTNTTTTSSSNDYQVSLSLGFILTTLFLATLVAYHAGTMTRQNILQNMNTPQAASATSVSPLLHQWLRKMVATNSETSSTMDGQTEDAWIHCQDQQKQQENHLCDIQSKKDATEGSSSSSSSSDSSDDDDEEEKEEEREKTDGLHMNGEPVGQHMLLEFGPMQFSYEETVAFLLQRAARKGWYLQSYHQQCKKSTASNNYHNNKQEATCILVFDNGNRMAFHSQANALDIYSRAKDEETLLSLLEQLAPLNISRWAFKPRGTPWGTFDAGLEDMYNGLLGSLEYTYKSLVGRQTSAFQEISFYDTISPTLLKWDSCQKSLSTTEDNYYTRNAHLFQPDRQMFLDGVVQSRSYGERAYHEALVHPSMLAHPNPERVAIIGAGEGATLREVLKHSTVKEVIMIEIDSTVMELSRKYLPSWNDCSDFILPEGMTNPTGNCFDDPRAKVFSEDAIQWFVDRYYNNDGTYEPFDIIIMDALDPGDKVEFSDMLFDNTALTETFYRALSPDGIFLSQTGEEQYLDDPNPRVNRDIYALLFQQNLAKVGFFNVRGYEEASTRFDGIWSFLLASKGDDTSRWFANAAQIDLELQRRAMHTKSGKWPFHYFDGATMASYQHASRPVAEVTCRTYPHWPSCQRGAGLAGSQNIALDDALTLQEDGTVIAQRDIEPGTYVGLEQCVQGILHIPHTAADIIASSSSPQWDVWKTLISNFSMPTPLWGQHAIDADVSGYVLMQQCPSKTSFLEDLAKGEVNEMYKNFWRTHSCAARRTSKEMIKAVSETVCGQTL